ncbi:MAG: Rid family hydrolase [Clostridiales bacterium]
MFKEVPTNRDEKAYPSCVVSGNYIYISHHDGGHDRNDITYQMEETFKNLDKTLKSINITFDDIIQINLYLKNFKDIKSANSIFCKFFKNGFPKKMKTITKNISNNRLCMIDGVAYKKS